jgi:hypothetical protein
VSTASGAPYSHLDLEVLAAQLRRHADDLALYAGLMLGVLSCALPPEMIRVRREGRLKARLAGREPAVLGVSVLLGNWRYELDRAEFAGRPTAKIIHESGGVAMSNRVVGIDEWSQRMAADLVNVVGAHADAVEALHRLTAQ